jgi:hypothetical protein
MQDACQVLLGAGSRQANEVRLSGYRLPATNSCRANRRDNRHMSRDFHDHDVLVIGGGRNDVLASHRLARRCAPGQEGRAGVSEADHAAPWMASASIPK